MFFVYVLQSLKTKEFYKGLTDNLDRRLKEHLGGKCHSTRNKFPLKLIHVEIYNNRNQAREVEKFLKSDYEREIIEEIAEVACPRCYA